MVVNLVWPLILGGGLTLLGGVVSQYWIYTLDKRKHSARLLISKAEELCQALCEHELWIEEKGSYLFNQKQHTRSSPFSKVSMLQRIYFPWLKLK